MKKQPVKPPQPVNKVTGLKATREWANLLRCKGSEATREPVTRERLRRENFGARG